MDSPLSRSLTFDDVVAWPESAVALLERSGILKRGGVPQTVVCDGCEEGCIEDVEWWCAEDDILSAYVICERRSDIGRVKVRPERLATWEVSCGGLADVIARELGGRANELARGRLWLVGKIQTDSVGTDVLIARSLGSDDGEGIWREIRGRAGVLFVPSIPTGITVSTESLEVIRLEDVLTLDGSGLSLNMSRIEEAAQRAFERSYTREVKSDRYRYRFAKGVDSFDIVYDGVAVNPPLRISKGLCYIQFLLAHPGEEYFALDIVLEVDGTLHEAKDLFAVMSPGEIKEYGALQEGFVDAGEIMDEDYEKDVRRRLNKAKRKRDLANARGDQEAAEEAESEIRHYSRALAEAIGKGGGHRALGDYNERARVAVTQAVHRAMRKLQKQHPPLYEHLSSSLRTGTVCIYNPAAPIDWNF